MKVLITGYTGFIGKYLISELQKKYEIILLGRRGLDGFKNFDIENDRSILEALNSSDVIIHCAGKATSPKSIGKSSWAEYQEANVDLTDKISLIASKSNLKHFIFLSTIKVYGERSYEKPFSVDSNLQPGDYYATSKVLSEECVKTNLSKSDVSFSVLRLPIVYGKGVGANFRNLIRLVKTGLPLPFGMLNNKRSFLNIKNLIDVITLIINKKIIKNNIMNISDRDDLSTIEVIKNISNYTNSKSYLIPVPKLILNFFGTILLKRKMINSLILPLQVDCTDTTNTLGWQPRYNFNDGLKEILSNDL